MVCQPSKESATPLYYEINQLESGVIRKIYQAWEQITRKGKELGKRGCGTSQNYQEWLKQRVQEVKLPFLKFIPVKEEVSAPAPVDLRELEELRHLLAKFEEEKIELQKNLEESHAKIRLAQEEIVQKEQSPKKISQKAEDEKELKLKNTRMPESGQ